MLKTIRNNKNVILTAVTALFSQLSSTLIALILPRLIILKYSSDLNGVLSTARQFTTYLNMIDSGIAAATCYQFINAFKNKNENLIKNLFVTVGDFFRKVAFVVIGITLLISLGYSIFAKSDVDPLLQIYIFVAYSLGTIVAFWTFFKYNLVLFSSGKQYTITFICVISNLLTLALQSIFIILNINIIWIVAVHPLCIIARLIVIKAITIKQHAYLKQNNGCVDKKLLDQKWNSIIFNIADSMKTFAPLLCISLFFGAAYASVYTVYESILHLGSSILVMCSNGLTPILGKNLINNSSESRKQFRVLCNVVFSLSGVITACFSALFINFINIYLGTNSDINYTYTFLAFGMIFNFWLIMIRTNYELLIKAHGRIKELRQGAIYEILIAISFCLIASLTLGFEYCIIGVIISSIYRTVRMCIFCVKTLNQAKTIYIDLLVWLTFTTLVAITFAFCVPQITNLLNFIIACAMTLISSMLIFILFLYIMLRIVKRTQKSHI